MTSRTPVGGQQRPPQRALNNSSSSVSGQRPSHPPRSLSHPYSPSSPVRKDPYPNTTGDAVDTSSQSRNGSGLTPRRAGSRLRLELSNDAGAGVASATASPQSLTPSRLAYMSDVADGGDNTSPAVSRASQTDVDNPPMPMPKRRPQAQQHVKASREPVPPPTQAAKKDGRPKPYTVEVPSKAPRFSASQKHDPLHRNDTTNRDPFSKGLFSGYADFFPWTGNHHEDQWSAEAIQKGTWDKTTQNETSSARLAIFPPLKQKSGLQALSTIFMGVLNQRRHRGQINVPSTFKPPPRVTLTDTKREVWLKDLANPAISLRRLSRTIPHGIRGRILLDQCLNKSVPTERAVWLAKCVGANEIRAFKRKGVNGAFVMGGELKWIRDWTIFVEQFVDAVVVSVGEPDWKTRVTYAIRLATTLYAEHLLDRDHYLDWIMSGLENSPHSRIPMWILIAQICWVDLIRSRKFGRRLAFALLHHLDVIHNDPDSDILIQLSSQLAALLKSLMQESPESFVAPNLWTKYRDTLGAFLSEEDSSARAAFGALSARNSRLVVASTASPRPGRQQLVKLLDSTLKHPPASGFSATCWEACDDKWELAKTLVRWATSPHRPGLAKIYVATNLFDAWASLPCDPTAAVLDLLDDVQPHEETRKKFVYHLATELVRVRRFSVPQYLQWLIARGGYRDAAQVDADQGPCATRLLVELPTYCLSDKVKTERANLLRRAGNYSVASEEQDVTNAFRCVKQTLGLPLPADDPLTRRKPMSLRKLCQRMRMSTQALRSSIGAYIRDFFERAPLDNPSFSMTTGMFLSVRSILETVEDFAMLAAVLKTTARSSDPDTLASFVDTINANLGVFFALGSADDLFEVMFDRLRTASLEQGAYPRPLLAALTNLAQRLPHREDTAKHLLHELVQSDRTSAIDACSPISDSNLNSATQTSNGEVPDEIDKLLASGNTIDHPTMNRFFRNIVPKLEAGWLKADGSCRAFASLLTRLRVFDMKHFDRLMADWVSHIRTLKERPQLTALYPLLISLGCLSMQTLLSTASASSAAMNGSASTSTDSDRSTTYLQELIKVVLTKLAPGSELSPEEVYGFHTQQEVARSDCSKKLLVLIRNSVAEYALLKKANPALTQALDDTDCQDAILETLKIIAVVDSNTVADTLNAKSMPPEAIAIIYKIAAKLLGAPEDDPHEASFDRILSLANELTLPFCQLKLNLQLSMEQAPHAKSDEQGPSRFDIFAHAMDRAIEARNIMWTSMLPCLSEDITQHLKSQARGRFLDLIPSFKSANLEQEATSDNRMHLSGNLLGVVEAIISGQPPAKSAQLTAILAEKLTDLWEIIASADCEDLVQFSVIKHWLPVLLKFVTIHSSASDTAHLATASTPSASGSTKTAVSPNPDIRARIVLVLCGILVDLQRLPSRDTGALPQQVFDIAILLVDALSEDVRTQCAKTILAIPGGTQSSTALNTAASSDPRLYYILSAPQPTRADNLMLSHREKTNAPHSAAVRGMGAMYGIGPAAQDKLSPFTLRRWELLSEPTPNVGENDTSLSLGLFEAIKVQ